MTLERPPGGEHQANGTAEEAFSMVIDQARVLKLQVEARVGGHIVPMEPIMPCFIRWAAMGVPRYQIGTDGKPYERQPGRTCVFAVVPFGEMVIFRMAEVVTGSHQALE